MKAINKHTAKIADIAPGASAEVDESNPTVKLALGAGLLVDAAVEAKRALESVGGDSALVDENLALKAKLAELEASLAKLSPPAPPARPRSKVEG